MLRILIYLSLFMTVFLFLTDLLPENSRLQEVFNAVPVDTETFKPCIGNKF